MKKKWNAQTFNTKILVLKSHVFVAVFFVANNKRKPCNNNFAFFSAWLKQWRLVFSPTKALSCRFLFIIPCYNKKFIAKRLFHISPIFFSFKRFSMTYAFSFLYPSILLFFFKKSIFLTSNLLAKICFED